MTILNSSYIEEQLDREPHNMFFGLYAIIEATFVYHGAYFANLSGWTKIRHDFQFASKKKCGFSLKELSKAKLLFRSEKKAWHVEVGSRAHSALGGFVSSFA